MTPSREGDLFDENVLRRGDWLPVRTPRKKWLFRHLLRELTDSAEKSPAFASGTFFPTAKRLMKTGTRWTGWKDYLFFAPSYNGLRRGAHYFIHRQLKVRCCDNLKLWTGKSARTHECGFCCSEFILVGGIFVRPATRCGQDDPRPAMFRRFRFLSRSCVSAVLRQPETREVP